MLAAVLLVVLIPPAGAQLEPTPSPDPDPSRLLDPERGGKHARLVVQEMTPRVVTATGAGVLTVRGYVRNTGDRPIDDLAVRIQRGSIPLHSDAEMREAVAGLAPTDVATRFVDLAARLLPGQRMPFRLDVALRGPPGHTLQLTEPGIYPLLVNLNGIPEFGGPARLSSVPTLLPVLGLPSAPGLLSERHPGSSAPINQLPLTMLWPLTARTTLQPGPPGTPAVLGDESLAAQLAPGGRLDGLVTALEQAVPPGSPLSSALCVAVDPALLDTVEQMSRGYQVLAPEGTVAGRGTADAARWLERLRRVVAGRCVLPLPYGDPDLVALSRAGLTDLEALAASAGVHTTERVLRTQPLTGLAWPAGGVLDDRTLSDLLSLGYRSVLTDPAGLAEPRRSATGGAVRLAGSAPLPGDAGALAVLVDPLISTALRPTAPSSGTSGTAPVGIGAAGSVLERPAGTRGALATQDAIGVLAYRALNAADPDGETTQPVVVVPPRSWQATAAEATTLLRFAEQLITRRLAEPRDLPGLASTEPSRHPTAVLSYPVVTAATEVPPPVTAQLQANRDLLRELQASTARDPSVGLEPAALLDPMRLGLLRAVSARHRGDPASATRDVAAVAERLDNLRRGVHAVQPPGPYTLASRDAPVLLTLTNELPVAVRARVQLSGAVGLKVGQVGEVVLPASSNRQVVVPAVAARAGQFSLQVDLTTPGGTPLGEPVRLRLRSTDSGTMTVVLTTSAAAVLVLLVAARVTSRVRAARRNRNGNQVGPG